MENQDNSNQAEIDNSKDTQEEKSQEDTAKEDVPVPETVPIPETSKEEKEEDIPESPAETVQESKEEASEELGEEIQEEMGEENSETKTEQEGSEETEESEDQIIIPEVERITVGIPGFDSMIEKGIPKGSTILVSGGPGTGKTTFCLQTLAYAAKQGQKTLYLSFEEAKDQLMQHMRDYGFDPVDLEKKGMLKIKCLDPFEVSRSVEALLANARGELLIDIDEVANILPADFKPERVVFDSLSAVAAAFAGKDEGYRIYIEQLFRQLKKTGATAFLISEIEQSLTKYSKSGVEEFLADVVIAFYNIRKNSLRLNAIEIIKIRGSPHVKKVVPFKMLGQKGIEVYPLEDIFVEFGDQG